MALQVCRECTTRYAPAAVCPHCGAEEWISELAADEQGSGGGPAVVSTDDDGPPDYTAYRVTDLRDLARDRGLPVTGAKPDLAAALAQWDADHPDGGGEPGPDGD